MSKHLLSTQWCSLCIYTCGLTSQQFTYDLTLIQPNTDVAAVTESYKTLFYLLTAPFQDQYSWNNILNKCEFNKYLLEKNKMAA